MNKEVNGWRERFEKFNKQNHSLLGALKSHWASFIEKEIEKAKREAKIEVLNSIRDVSHKNSTHGIISRKIMELEEEF